MKCIDFKELLKDMALLKIWIWKKKNFYGFKCPSKNIFQKFAFKTRNVLENMFLNSNNVLERIFLKNPGMSLVFRVVRKNTCSCKIIFWKIYVPWGPESWIICLKTHIWVWKISLSFYIFGLEYPYKKSTLMAQNVFEKIYLKTHSKKY